MVLLCLATFDLPYSKMKVLAAGVLLLLAACVSAGDDPTVSLPGVLDLTPDTFDKHVNGAKGVLVEFYAPWCGHCKRMTGEFKTLGETITNDPKLKSKVAIAKVNADEHRSLGERFGVRGFPTLKFFPRGAKVDQDGAKDYEGARTHDKFLEYLNARVAEDKAFARIEELDALVKDFAGSKKDAAEKLIADITKKVADLTDDSKTNGEVYVKLMQKGLEKGAEYFAKEKARLDRMLSSGSVAAAKAEEMIRKSSILGAFLPETDEVSKS